MLLLCYCVINCSDLMYDSWDYDSDFVEEDGPTASFSSTIPVKHTTSHCPSTSTVSSAGTCHSSPIVIDSDKMTFFDRHLMPACSSILLLIAR